jgi:hypothetical protein
LATPRSSSGSRTSARLAFHRLEEGLAPFERGIAGPAAIRHDNGNAYMSDDFQAELAFPGMASSPSFVREPEGNGVAERFIRTVKENLLWVRHFATVSRKKILRACGQWSGLPGYLSREPNDGRSCGQRHESSPPARPGG